MGEKLSPNSSQLGPASKHSQGCHYTRQTASQNPDHEGTTVASGFMASRALGTQDLENVSKMLCGEVHAFLFGVP